MPVYFFTFHAYRSWRADHPRGFIQRGEPGVQTANQRLADYRESISNKPKVRFSMPQCSVLLESAKDICARRDWILYAATSTPTHIHLLIGSKQALDVVYCRTRLKSLLGKSLSDHVGKTGMRWFSRGHHTEQVLNEQHMEELIKRYVPKHKAEGGVVYQKGWGIGDR